MYNLPDEVTLGSLLNYLEVDLLDERTSLSLYESLTLEEFLNLPIKSVSWRDKSLSLALGGKNLSIQIQDGLCQFLIYKDKIYDEDRSAIKIRLRPEYLESPELLWRKIQAWV